MIETPIIRPLRRYLRAETVLLAAGLLLATGCCGPAAAQRISVDGRAAYWEDPAFAAPIRIPSPKTRGFELLAELRKRTGAGFLLRGEWLEEPVGFEVPEISARELLDRWAAARGGRWEKNGAVWVLVPGKRQLSGRPDSAGGARRSRTLPPAPNAAQTFKALWDQALPAETNAGLKALRPLSPDQRTHAGLLLLQQEIDRRRVRRVGAPALPERSFLIARIVQGVADGPLRLEVVARERDASPPGVFRNALTVLLGLRGRAEEATALQVYLERPDGLLWLRERAVTALSRLQYREALPLLAQLATGDTQSVPCLQVADPEREAAPGPGRAYPVRWAARLALDRLRTSGTRLPSFASRALAREWFWQLSSAPAEASR